MCARVRTIQRGRKFRGRNESLMRRVHTLLCGLSAGVSELQQSWLKQTPGVALAMGHELSAGASMLHQNDMKQTPGVTYSQKGFTGTVGFAGAVAHARASPGLLRARARRWGRARLASKPPLPDYRCDAVAVGPPLHGEAGVGAEPGGCSGAAVCQEARRLSREPRATQGPAGAGRAAARPGCARRP